MGNCQCAHLRQGIVLFLQQNHKYFILKNANLRPERLNALEAGLEAWFFNGRFQLDLAGYQNTSIDQIISRPISQTSGFSNVLVLDWHSLKPFHWLPENWTRNFD